MFNKETTYITFSLIENTLRAVQFKSSGTKPKLLNILKKTLKGKTDDERSKELKGCFGKLKVRKSKVICIVPSNAVTIKNIEIPSTDPEEIHSIVNLQAGRHTPYSREEILIGFVNIGVYQSNYTKVLLVIVNRKVIKDQMGLLQKAKVPVENVYFAPEGNARFYFNALNLKEQDPPIGIIDISQEYSDFTISFKGNVIACRSILIGKKALASEGASAKEKLIKEITDSLESYKNEDIDKVPTTFYLATEGLTAKDLMPSLKDALKCELKIISFVDHLKVGNALKNKLIDSMKDDSFFGLISCGMDIGKTQVDLLPEEVRIERSIKEQSKQLVTAGTLAFLIVCLVCSIVLTKTYYRAKFLGLLDNNYKEESQEVVRLQKLTNRSRIIKEFFATRQVGLDAIIELYKIIPQEVYLVNISVDEDGAINIQGTADVMSRVFSLVTSLENSPLFMDVETGSTSSKKEGGKTVSAFDIKMKLSIDEDKSTNADVVISDTVF